MEEVDAGAVAGVTAGTTDGTLGPRLSFTES